MSREPVGRVIITWPAASSPPTALAAWGVAFDDADTGEQLLDVVAVSMQLGSAKGFESGNVIEVDLTRLVDADGKPIGGGPGAANRLALTDEYAEHARTHRLGEPRGIDAPEPPQFVGQLFRTGRFRYIVAEMRLAASEPGAEPRRVVTARLAPDAPPLAEHAHAFPASPDMPIAGPCACGMTYEQWEALRLADEALRLARELEPADGA